MKIPYKLTPALNDEARHQYMLEAIKTGLPRLRPTIIDEEKSISIACYGPSLLDTWKDIKHPIISVSGATHFLSERGVIPDYHVDCDPRLHKVKHVQPPVPGVHYLMGSCCHPSVWEVLKDQKVTLVHFYMSKDTHPFLAQHDPGEGLIWPGSTVGLGAIHVGGVLGYRHFEIHGMDGSLREGKRHAGPHYGHPQGGFTWQAGNVIYQTSKIMSNACAEVINTFDKFPIFGVFHGRGLQQALIDESGLQNVALANTENAEKVRNYKAFIFPKGTPVEEVERFVKMRMVEVA